MNDPVKDLFDRYRRLRSQRASQDVRTAQVMMVRAGHMSKVAPDLFPDMGPWQEPIVANMIDIAARDLSEMLAPLPAFNCTSPTMVSERERARATDRTKIVGGILSASDLQVQMYTGADAYLTAGFLPFRVEPDWDNRTPMIRVLDPVGSYAEFDRFGRVTAFFQRVVLTRDELSAQFPEYESRLFPRGRRNSHDLSTTVELVLFHDKDWDVAFCTTGDPFVLSKVRNPLGKVLVRVARRAGIGQVARGQFDDVLFVQLAKAQFALLKMKVAHDAAHAPLTVPTDVAEVPMGPDAVIHTNDPAGVRRVPLEIPPSVFAEEQGLERELRLGSRFPEVRTGNSDASIVTGQGVMALMGGYESQVRAHQAIFARTLAQVASLALEMDEALFAGEVKELRGAVNGTSYALSYDPGKVIKGDYTVEAKYGLMAGLDPSRALVFGLQARNDKLISRDFLQRELPFDLDVEDERQKVDIEDLEEAAKLAILGYAQSIPALAANGQDPSGAVKALLKVVEGRRKGKDLSALVEEAFAPEPAPEPESPEMAALEAAGGGQGEPVPGQAPPGRPDLMTMLAGLDSSGQANLSANVKRQRVI